MKYIGMIFFGMLLSLSARSQSISLTYCYDQAMKHQAILRVNQAAVLNASLKVEELRARFWPQISAAYDYRYNPILQSSIIPVGLFNTSAPSDKTIAVKFGTTWNQTAGVTVLQPLFDFAVKANRQELQAQERIEKNKLQQQIQSLQYQLLDSYVKILLHEKELAAAAVDSQRTYTTLQLQKVKLDAGKLLVTDYNTALIQHRANIKAFQMSASAWMKEQVVLSYLTGISLDSLVGLKFETKVLDQLQQSGLGEVVLDSLANYRDLKLQSDLLEQRKYSEKVKYKPTLSAQGYLGANQFTNQFNPFQSNTWFGNSYVGIVAKLPILIGEDKKKRIRQLEVQQNGLQEQMTDLQQSLEQQRSLAREELKELNFEEKLYEENVQLYRQNVQVLQDRFEKGLATATDLNQQELLLQGDQLKKQQAAISAAEKKLTYWKNSGSLVGFFK